MHSTPIFFCFHYKQTVRFCNFYNNQLISQQTNKNSQQIPKINKEFLSQFFHSNKEAVVKNTKMQIKLKQTINYVQKMDKVIFNDNLKNQFACQCGKVYNAFPALYLHFQRSHKIKISTKLQDQFCSINKSGNVRKFTYFFSKEKYESESSTKRESLLSSILNQFLNSLANEYDKYPTNYLCSQLHKFLLEENLLQNQTYEMLTIYSLPTYFNSFMMKLSIQGKFADRNIWEYYCGVLITFCQWLNLKGYTNVKIQGNFGIPIVMSGHASNSLPYSIQLNSQASNPYLAPFGVNVQKSIQQIKLQGVQCQNLSPQNITQLVKSPCSNGKNLIEVGTQSGQKNQQNIQDNFAIENVKNEQIVAKKQII